MKRYTYVHFDDTGPHRAVLETDPYYLFSKLCVIDLYLRTKTNQFSKEESIQQTISGPSQLFSIRRFFFQNCSGDKVVQQSSLFYRFTITKNQCHYLHSNIIKIYPFKRALLTAGFLSGNSIFICKKIKIKIYYKKMLFWMTCRHFLKSLNV